MVIFLYNLYISVWIQKYRQTTLEPLYKMVHYNTILDIKWLIYYKIHTFCFGYPTFGSYLLTILCRTFEQVHLTTCFSLKHCGINGKQCRPWSDATSCGIWSESTLLLQTNGKQCRSWSDATFRGIWSGSTLFAQASIWKLEANMVWKFSGP